MSGQAPGQVTSIDPIQAAAQAFATGQDVSKAVYGDQAPADLRDENGPDQPEQEAQAEVSSEESPSEVSEPSTEEQEQPSEQPKPDVEELIVSDDSGRKKLKIDWNNREQIKKYISMAAGMRKFQAERDKYKAELEKVSPEHKEYKESWTALQKAYDENGVAGIINLVTGDKEGHQKYLSREMQKMKFREEASPQELERMELQELLDKERRDRERQKKEFDDILKKSQEKDSEANLKELKSQINPVFEKYRFAGKLGNPAAEARFDKAIWRDAMETLDALPEHTELTPEMVNKAFRDAASDYRAMIKQEADAKAKKVIESKKVAAKEAVVKSVTSGVKNNSSREAFDSDVKKGDWHSAIRGLLTGKVKL